MTLIRDNTILVGVSFQKPLLWCFWNIQLRYNVRRRPEGSFLFLFQQLDDVTIL